MYCCHVLKNLLDNAGEKGFSVLVSKHSDNIKFTLQMRALSFKDEQSASLQPLPSASFCMSVSGSMRLRYCPSCGKQLADLAHANPAAYEELATKHIQFQNNWG